MAIAGLGAALYRFALPEKPEALGLPRSSLPCTRPAMRAEQGLEASSTSGQPQ